MPNAETIRWTQRIAETGDPLVVARRAADLAIKEIRHAASHALYDGTSMDEIVVTPVEHPSLTLCRTILETHTPSPNDTRKWTDYFHLQSTLSTLPHSIYGPLVFQDTRHSKARSMVFSDAYTTHGKIIDTILSTMDNHSGDEARPVLFGALAEEVVMALLNYNRSSKRAANIGSMADDDLGRIDVRYRFFHRDETNTGITALLQVKSGNQKTNLPPNIVPVHTRQLLGGPPVLLSVAKIIAQEAVGGATQEDCVALREHSVQIHEKVVDHLRQRGLLRPRMQRLHFATTYRDSNHSA